MVSYDLIATSGNARRGVVKTPHDDINTPFFMNVATSAAIKGGISAVDLPSLKCQVMLCNTYHLHIRPGDEVVRDMGGLHKFTNWNRPILTDSGGFQVFSLAKLRRIKEEGVYFSSHVDGRKIFMGPEESMQIQHNLGADIVMAFDECIPGGQSRDYVEKSVARTTRWLVRCMQELERLKHAQQGLEHKKPTSVGQALFGINQGGTYADIRVRHMQELAELDLPGYAIGGLAVGEAKADMFAVIDTVAPHMPADKPRYLMGVGTPSDIIEAVYRGIDMFDCVMPTRNARHGTLFTNSGIMHVGNARFERDDRPIDEKCGCPTCQNFSRAYLRHLFKSQEYLGGRLASQHNLYFYNELMERIRTAIEADEYTAFKNEYSGKLAQQYKGI
ncbi:MAG: tRNA guanosine(34) transglycosylase Tgt [Oscillospiraceae bacterium]|nr:tRNA guanosine(34) transglycosylase Tgt [Oscillospiraceae bacterium]